LNSNHTENNCSCSQSCNGCNPALQSDDSNGKTLKGGWLVLTSVITFILPIIMALIGGIIAGNDYLNKFYGTLAGLVSGIATSYILFQLTLNTFKENTNS